MQNSIWISKHAIERYAARIEGVTDNLDSFDTARIRGRLLAAYQASEIITDAMRTKLGVRTKRKPGHEQRLATVHHNNVHYWVLLVCAPDNRHASGAMQLVTVYKVGVKTGILQD